MTGGVSIFYAFAAMTAVSALAMMVAAIATPDWYEVHSDKVHQRLGIFEFCNISGGPIPFEDCFKAPLSDSSSSSSSASGGPAGDFTPTFCPSRSGMEVSQGVGAAFSITGCVLLAFLAVLQLFGWCWRQWTRFVCILTIILGSVALALFIVAIIVICLLYEAKYYCDTDYCSYAVAKLGASDCAFFYGYAMIYAVIAAILTLILVGVAIGLLVHFYSTPMGKEAERRRLRNAANSSDDDDGEEEEESDGSDIVEIEMSQISRKSGTNKNTNKKKSSSSSSSKYGVSTSSSRAKGNSNKKGHSASSNPFGESEDDEDANDANLNETIPANSRRRNSSASATAAATGGGRRKSTSPSPDNTHSNHAPDAGTSPSHYGTTRSASNAANNRLSLSSTRDGGGGDGSAAIGMSGVGPSPMLPNRSVGSVASGVSPAGAPSSSFSHRTPHSPATTKRLQFEDEVAVASVLRDSSSSYPYGTNVNHSAALAAGNTTNNSSGSGSASLSGSRSYYGSPSSTSALNVNPILRSSSVASASKYDLRRAPPLPSGRGGAFNKPPTAIREDGDDTAYPLYDHSTAPTRSVSRDPPTEEYFFALERERDPMRSSRGTSRTTSYVNTAVNSPSNNDNNNLGGSRGGGGGGGGGGGRYHYDDDGEAALHNFRGGSTAAGLANYSTASNANASGGSGSGGGGKLGFWPSDWVFHTQSQLYWSVSQQLYLDPKSEHYFDPHSNKWYDPKRDMWYSKED